MDESMNQEGFLALQSGEDVKKRFPPDCTCYLGIIRPLDRHINLLFHGQTSRYVSGCWVAGVFKHPADPLDLAHSYKTDKTNGQGRKTCLGDGYSRRKDDPYDAGYNWCAGGITLLRFHNCRRVPYTCFPLLESTVGWAVQFLVVL